MKFVDDVVTEFEQRFVTRTIQRIGLYHVFQRLDTDNKLTIRILHTVAIRAKYKSFIVIALIANKHLKLIVL